MKLGITLTIAACAALSLAQSHQAGHMPKPTPPAPKMSKADWQKMYDKAEMYFNKRDADSIFKYMAPGAKMVMDGKEMSAKDGKAGMKQWFSMMKSLKCNLTVTSATQNGNMATVKDTFDDTGVMMNPETKKDSKYTGKGSETMTWVWMDGKWMIKKLVINSNKMTLDGKPFNPKM